MLFANTGANEMPAIEIASVDRLETIGSTDSLTETAEPTVRRMRPQPDNATMLLRFSTKRKTLGEFTPEDCAETTSICWPRHLRIKSKILRLSLARLWT